MQAMMKTEQQYYALSWIHRHDRTSRSVSLTNIVSKH